MAVSAVCCPLAAAAGGRGEQQLEQSEQQLLVLLVLLLLLGCGLVGWTCTLNECCHVLSSSSSSIVSRWLWHGPVQHGALAAAG